MTMLRPQHAGIPLPQPTPVSRPFWDGCAAGELRYQRCRTCGHAEFDPVWVCRHCGSDDMAWQVSDGRGEVYSHTVVWRPQTPEFTVPYAVVIVNFDEGFTLLTNLIGCTVEDVLTGMRVRGVFHQIGGGITLPYVEPDPEGNHGN
ncbi:Zn-ribbon domain-containing OB-fold protein [Nocardia sp. NPDC052278]|uniref:Zn-ribbon domain-containing OB-fold protein n=1 Tax=unclassified Nocardia TaxID=2637762 RepID=UPI00367BD627